MLKSFLMAPFQGSKKESGFALPLAIGTAMLAGFGVTYIGNRVDEAEHILNQQLISQTARTLYDQLEQASSSATAMLASSNENGAFKTCINNAQKGLIGKSCNLKYSAGLADCKSKDAKTRRECLAHIFGNKPLRQKDLASIFAGDFKYYNSSYYADASNKKAALLTGPYTRYGAKCEVSEIGTGGCGRVFVRTAYSTSITPKSSKVLIYYSIYAKQLNEEYVPVISGYAEPAIAICPEDHYIADLDANVGGASISCKAYTGMSTPAETSNEKGDIGDIGPQGPRG